MENILDFIRAALPWIAMGLLLAIFSARSAAKKGKMRMGKRATITVQRECVLECAWVLRLEALLVIIPV